MTGRETRHEAVPSVPAATLIIVLFPIALTITNRRWIVNFAVRILLIELDAVAPVPAALFEIVCSAITFTIANPRWRTNDAVRILPVYRNAVSSVPAALFGVVRLPIALSITNQRWLVNIAVGVARNGTVSSVPAAFFRIIIVSVATAIPNPTRIRNAAFRIVLVKHFTVTSVPTACFGVVATPTEAIADIRWITNMAVWITDMNTVATVPPTLYVVVVFVTATISNIGWGGSTTVWIPFVKLGTIPPIPPALLTIIDASMAEVITDSIRVIHVAVGIFLVKLEAVSAVPFTFRRIIPGESFLIRQLPLR
mmetsp:Transcript_6903/g.15070  ORF Transcript_6903/g.15070 Transcript_6903/m.15070 type:complete len:310 (+) Transcript_6903:647-1576(+)